MIDNRARRVAVIGGGAAGYMAAITCAESNRQAQVTLFEAASRPLAKVRISGGGRCNVTTGVQDPKELIAHYPRGGRELLGPFTRFGPRETCEWFERRGVKLKTESDGRVFPVSDSSETVIACLEAAALGAGVKTVTRAAVRSLESMPGGRFRLAGRPDAEFERVLITTGSAASGLEMARSIGHTLVPCVASLFSFQIDDPRLAGLAGVSVAFTRVGLQCGRRGNVQMGPLLVTHWGLSGPAILKLSAWGARDLAEASYKATLVVDWLPGISRETLLKLFQQKRLAAGDRRVASDNPTPLPGRLWIRLAEQSGVGDTTWSGLTSSVTERLLAQLKVGRFEVRGRGEFKEEFVTSGGVHLKEVDFRTMESKLERGLHFAGEILDVDGLTGGFNLQSAWTTGFVAGTAMSA